MPRVIRGITKNRAMRVYRLDKFHLKFTVNDKYIPRHDFYVRPDSFCTRVSIHGHDIRSLSLDTLQLAHDILYDMYNGNPYKIHHDLSRLYYFLARLNTNLMWLTNFNIPVYLDKAPDLIRCPVYELHVMHDAVEIFKTHQEKGDVYWFKFFDDISYEQLVRRTDNKSFFSILTDTLTIPLKEISDYNLNRTTGSPIITWSASDET